MNACRSGLRGALALCVGLLAGASALAQQQSPGTTPETAEPVELVREPRALALLESTSRRLAAARTMRFTAVVSYEYPSQLGPPIVYTTASEVTLQRPDKLRVITTGDGPASDFYYDGKAILAHAPEENLVAIAEAPSTIDAALKFAFDEAAIYFPFTDLIVADPYAAIADGLKLAFYIGRSKTVGGTTTEMVAYADDDVFVQVWIGTDDRLPRRARAVYSADPLRLRHQLDLSDWQIDTSIEDGAFRSARAASAAKIEFAPPVLAPSALPGPPSGVAPGASR